MTQAMAVGDAPSRAERSHTQRELGAAAVLAVYRVVKLSTLHSIDNQAMVRQVEETAAIITDYAYKTGRNLSILFGRGSVYVGGKLLRANRGVYEAALELGGILERLNATELGVAGDVRPQDLNALVTIVAQALRGQRFGRVPSPRIRLRDVDESSLLADRAKTDLSAVIIRTYATAIVTMRRYFDDVRQGRFTLSQRVRRVAQRLVDLSAGEAATFLGITSARNANSDDAGRAVNTAILSLTMARQITSDRIELSRIALASLLLDTARARATGMVPSLARSQVPTSPSPLVLPALGDQQEAQFPAGTAVVLTALGRLDDAAIARVVVDYEAAWVKRQALLGSVYQGLRQATIQARIVAVARAFNDLLTPMPGQDPVAADEAIAVLEKDTLGEPAARTVLRLLVGALGIFSTGMLVELSTGEVALVTRTPSNPSRYSMPTVRLVFDARGATLNNPIEIDLAEPALPGDVRRQIRRVVATSDDAVASSMRSLVGSSPSWAPSHDGGAREPPQTPRGRSLGPSHDGPQTPRGRSLAAGHDGGAREPPQTPRGRSLAPGRDAMASAGGSGLRDSARNASMAAASSEVSWSAQSYDDDDGFANDAPEPPRVMTPVPARAPSSVRAVESPADSRGDRFEPPAVPLPTQMQSPVSRDADPSSDPDALPPEATAQGDLGRTPFLHLLVYMLDQALSGTLVLNAPDGLEHRVYFHVGAPAKIRTGGMVAPLDRVILELGLLDQATLQGTLLEISKAKALHGRQLVVRGLLQREQVVGVLALQLFSKLMSLFELPSETTYAYYDGRNLLSTYGGPELLPCEPLEAIMSGVRLRATDAVVDATIERIVDAKLGVHPDTDARRFGLTYDEAAVLDMLRARRMTLDEVVAAGVAQERVVRLTIYAMAVTRYIDLGAGGRPPIGLATRSAVPVGTAAARAIATGGQDGGSREPPQTPPSRDGGSREPPRTPRPASRNMATAAPTAPPTPRQPSPMSAPVQQQPAPVSAPVQERAVPSAPAAASAAGSRRSGVDVAARRAELEQRVQVLDSQNCFEILGLPQDAAQEQVQAAYFQAAKIWHPDRQPAELAEVRPQIARLFARISDAYQTLSDPEKRAEHVKSIAAGGGTPQQAAQVARIVDAAFEFQKAEILLKKGDLAGAEALATTAVQADPEQPEYLATLAWIQFQRRPPPPGFQAGQETNHWDDLLQVLDAVLAKEPRYERGVFYRATMLKRAGRGKKAMVDFKLAAELNPRNTDALREVRLFDMRRGQPGAAPRGRAEVAAKAAEPGLFNRLFKK